MNVNDYFQYLNIGLPQDVLQLKYYGDFSGAIMAIDHHLAKEDTPAALRYCLLVQKEIIKRLPEDYPYTKEEALAVARKAIPSFSEEEFDQLEQDCRIEWIYVNGVKHYFNRYFDSLCKTDLTIATRAGADQVGSDGYDGEGLLTKVFQEMHEQGYAKRRIKCRSSLILEDHVYQKGQKIRAYLPLPCQCDAQSDINIESVSPTPTYISPQTAPQRVVFWEEIIEENHPFEVVFSYTQTAAYTDLSAPLEAKPLTGDFAKDLCEVQPHIVFTPYIRSLVATLTEGVEAPLEKARNIYDFITKHVKYSYMRPYFGLENIAENCARNLVGDCGVMTLLFITLCRAAGIPARWQSGWKADPGFCGAHDWAQFYVAPYGWLYADPSFGCGAFREKNEAKRQHYFGNIDPYRMIANTQFEVSFDVPKDHFRADPYDNQVGEMELADRGLCYDEFKREKEVLTCEEKA